MILSRLFSVDFGSAIKIVSFSVRHKSHSFPPLDKGCALAFIDQVTFVSKPSFLHFVRYVDSEVECCCSGSRKLDLCPFHLSLNEFFVTPIYCFVTKF